MKEKMTKLTILAALLGLMAFQPAAADDLDVQYIAVHFGDAGYNEVLDASEFSQFSFYTADGEVYGYTEDQKMIGSPNYLTGYYGEVPEKMGFGANHRGDYKNKYSFPYKTGAIYVIDKNGTISYQLPPEKMELHGDRNIRNDINRAIRRARKGKEADIMKERKREYLKESPVGELESRKGADQDKRGEGLVEWPVPDLQLKDADGNTVGLRELTQGKATVLVLYTLNGVTWKKGDNDGNIKKEWKGNKLMSPEAYGKKSEEEFAGDADEDKGGFANAAKFLGKEAGKSMTRQNNIRDIWSAEGDLRTDMKASSYQYFLQNLKFVQRWWGED
ncbi:MAG: hypothetical protein KGY60_09765 [Bacteroidales bacterium]|nr:hypothetical protein [Bacteroidales bacterium]